MRTARALPVALALALAPGWARAEPPRVSVRLDYTRGKGGATCPVDPAALRAAVEHVMGYDPFEPSASERLAVVVSSQDGAFAALVERFNAAGVSTWSETFSQKKPTPGNCAALFPPLASYLDGLFLSYQRAPAPLPATPPPEPAAPAPTPPPAPTVPPVPPELPNVPNPARVLPTRVAIVSYALASVFLGLGIAWSVDAQNKASAARTLAGQPYAGATYGCTNGQAPSGYCVRLLGAWHSEDKANELRNGWLGAAGVSGAIGIVATFWALSLPATIRAQAQITVRPGGLVIHGSF